MKHQSSVRTSLLHIFALNGFAVAQPILDLLGDNQDFFVARGSHEADLYALLAFLILGLPLLLAIIYKALASISNKFFQVTHHVVMAVLMAVILLPALKKLEISDAGLIVAAIGLGTLFSLAYRYLQGVRIFVTALSPIPLVFAAVFLLGAAVRETRQTGPDPAQSGSTPASGNTPVVMVIFDEFALTALMDADRNIDKTIFPNFYKLSKQASWYRNATTVATATMISVPAILTGNYPKEFVSQSYTNYPDTLFTMLAGSHRMNVFESTTSLCSAELCPNSIKLTRKASSRLKILLADVGAIYLHIIATPVLSKRLPVINMTWENYWQLDGEEAWQRHNYGGRLEQIEFFIDSIVPGDRPAVNLIHTNFPHLPYQYLPSGKRYQGEWEVPGLDFSRDRWGDNSWMITQAYQRFLLQAATADLAIGKLLEHLKTIGIYEESMIVVTADHGVSFYPDSQRRDAPPFATLEKDVLPIPLFIKYPQQQNGEISDVNVETIDILPTIARALGSGDTLQMDGRPLQGNTAPRAEKLAFHAYRDFLQYRSDASGELKYETLQWKLKNFKPSQGIDGLFAIGKNPELLGMALDSFDVQIDEQLSIKLDMPELFDKVDQNSGFIPARISGEVTAPQAVAGDSVVIAVNSTVRAVTELYPPESDSFRFSAMVPEESFKNGQNRVTAYLSPTNPNGRYTMIASHEQTEHGSLPPARENWQLSTLHISMAGVTYPLQSEKITGHLEYAGHNDGTIELFGWAIDVDGRDSVDKVVVFEDGQYVYSGVTGMPRGEGGQHDAPDAILLGFQFIIPENLFQQPGQSNIRLFGVSKNGYAAELLYFADYDWSR